MVSMLVSNDSHMITLSQSDSPIRLIAPGSAQWLCLLPPSSSIPLISVHLVVHLCRCRRPTSFPKEAGSLDQVDAFRTRSLCKKHSVLVVRQPEIALSPSLHAPPCAENFSPVWLWLSGFQQSNRQQAIPISAALEGPGAPDYATVMASCPACLLAMAMRSHRRGDALLSS